MTEKMLLLLFFSGILLLVFLLEVVSVFTPGWYITRFSLNGTDYRFTWGFFTYCISSQGQNGNTNCYSVLRKEETSHSFWIALSIITLLLYFVAVVFTSFTVYRGGQEMWEKLMKFVYGFTVPPFVIQIILAIWLGTVFSKVNDLLIYLGVNMNTSIGYSYILHIFSCVVALVFIVAVHVVRKRSSKLTIANVC